MAMRMREQQALRKEQKALRRKELAEKKRLEEGIFNLHRTKKLNNKRTHDMKKKLKDIQKDMKKDLKKKKPLKESDSQHKINIKF